MGQGHNIYGIDIETDTSLGIDPAIGPITRVALSGCRFDETFAGPETEMLAALDDRLSSLPPGVLATWNGGTFDLPYIADRARLLGVGLGLRLCRDRTLSLGRSPLPGHSGAYRGAWGHHGHIDTFRLYGHPGGGSVWSSLRTIGRLVGIGPAPVVRRPDDLANEALHAHAASDARLARVLAERRVAAVLRLIDHIEVTDAEPEATALARSTRQGRAVSAGEPYRPAVAI